MLSKESYIIHLDLSFIEKRLVDRHHWAQEDAGKAVRRYKNFLILVYRYSDHSLAPAPDIDEAWHVHILFTQEYTKACQCIFGEYLHHTPAQNSDPEEKEMMKNAQIHAADLYLQEFKEPYLLELDVSSFW